MVHYTPKKGEQMFPLSYVQALRKECASYRTKNIELLKQMETALNKKACPSIVINDNGDISLDSEFSLTAKKESITSLLNNIEQKLEAIDHVLTMIAGGNYGK